MVKRINTSETNDKINNFDIKRSFFIFKKLLFLIGRPFYVLLSSTLIIVLFIFYITGYSIRVFFLYFAKAFVKIFSL